MSPDHRHNGFPLGWFNVQSVAAKGRVWDVEFASHCEGAHIILFPPKKHETKGHNSNKDNQIGQYGKGADETNQMFFIDESGALCSKWAGHAIEVYFENDRDPGYLGLRHRRPMVHPPMIRTSFARSVFKYSEETQHIEVTIQTDQGSLQPFDDVEPTKKYLIKSLPKAKSRGIADDLRDAMQHAYPPILSPGGTSIVDLDDDNDEQGTRELRVFDCEQYHSLTENDKERCKFVLSPIDDHSGYFGPQHRSTWPQ